MRKRFAVVMSLWILLHAYVGARLLSGAGLDGLHLALAWLGLGALGLAPSPRPVRTGNPADNFPRS